MAKSIIKFISCPALLLSSFIIFCGSDNKEMKPVIRPVRYIEALATGGSRVRSFTGVAQAGLESNLSFKVAGTIKRIPVKVGDRINSGSLIAELDAESYQLQLQQAKASLEQAQAQQRNATSSYDRIRSLYENNNVSKNDLDQSRSAYESANASVKTLVQSYEMARLHLSYTKLNAPVSGSISRITREVNENVAAGTSIVLLTSGSRTEVTVAIPEVLIALIKEGTTVNVKFDAIPGKEFSAVVREVGVSSGQTVTTFPVTVRLNTQDKNIRPGMAAEVAFRFDYKDGRERILVPPHSVGEDRDGRYVFIVEPSKEGLGITHKKNVVVGELTSDGLEILSGIIDGDLVVTAGISKISDGQTVKLMAAKEG